MSRIRRRPVRRRVASAATAAAAVLALTATACGPGDDGGTDDGGKNPEETEQPADDSAGPSGADRVQDLLDRLDVDIDVEAWIDGEWANWDKDQWLREIGEYVGVIMEDFWDRDRMEDAEDREKSVDEDEIDEGDGSDTDSGDPADDQGVTDPAPTVVDAVAQDTPYSANSPAIGKVFMETPEGTMVCSGAVVQDPDNPGASNLVATAGHCVHEGAAGGWFRQLIFVPSYNDQGKSAEELGAGVDADELSPYGIWWADYVSTTQYWVDNGAAEGGFGAHQDFAVMSVVPEAGDTTASLEEMVGEAYPIDFDAPAVSGIGTTQIAGYPAAPPYDGESMFSCTGPLSRLSLDPAEPGMYRGGCTMTGGSSGGPWLAPGPDGEPHLISVTSIGPLENTWLAGPRLADAAEAVFDDARSS